MKQIILDTIADLCAVFLYYDRKQDENLTIEQLKESVNSGEITIDEMVAEFRKHIENTLRQKQTKIKEMQNEFAQDKKNK